MPRSPSPRPSVRRRMMACTTSIGPGATNMVTAAARRACQPPAACCCCPATSSPTAGPIRCCSRSRISATARFRPTTASARSRAISTASRGPSRSSRRCSRAMQVLTDPAECGPVTLALCQDVQTEAFDYPGELLRRARLDAAPAAPGRERTRGGRGAARGRREQAAHHRRRRRALFAGRRATWRPSAEAHGIPVGGDPGRQIRAAATITR